MAFQNAAKKARPVLLEPVMAVEIETPEEFMGNVMGDLSARRGNILGMDALSGSIKQVRAQVPLAEMFGYSTTLRSLSQGRASYSMELAHYADVPAHIAASMLVNIGKRRH